jgi:hypothetical protein
VDNIGDLGPPAIEGRSGLAAEQRIAVVAVDRGIEQWAAPGKRAWWLLHKILHQQQKLLQRASAIFKSAPSWLTDRLPGIIEGGRGQILFARKVPVKAALFEPTSRAAWAAVSMRPRGS